MTAIVRFSLRFRGVVIVLAAILLVYGLYTLTEVNFDVFPEFAPPQVVIRVEAPGFSPEQVEVLVTTPIEHAIGGVAGVASIRSHSLQGLSAITVVFSPGSDIYRARQLVAERLASLSQPLPRGVTPFMSPLTSSAGTVLQLGLTSEKRSLMDLRTVADWIVKPRLLAVSGVAQVQTYGGYVRQLQVQLQPEKLLRYHLSIQEVVTAAGMATALRGAGFVETENQRITIHTEGQSLSPAQVAGIVVAQQQGANITLGDVARIAQAPAPPVGAASIMGRPGIVFIVSSQYGANTLDVTRKLDQAMEELRQTLESQEIVLYPNLFRPATFIHTAIHNVLSALAIGAVLVIIVLFLFLFNLRTAGISFVAIPLSLLTAIIVLHRLGFSLNIMTLGGLAIAIGEIVDDAVIDVENIFRRLRENRTKDKPRPVLPVVLDASIEVRSAVVFATFAVVLVFLPILTLSGVAGRLFAPLGAAYILAVLSSLAVALTVTPALCLLLLGHWDSGDKQPPVVRWLKKRYRAVLLRVGNHSRPVLLGVAGFIGGGLACLPFLSGEFLPMLREGSFIVHITAIPGTSLGESLRIGNRVSGELLKLPYVDMVSQKTGRAREGASIRGLGSSEIDINMKAELAGRFRPQEVHKRLSRFSGLNIAVHTFLKERIGETISGYAAPVVINIFGDHLDVLDRKGEEVARVVAAMPGVADVTVQSVPEAPRITVKIRNEALAHWGFDPVAVLDAVQTAYAGRIVGQQYEDDRVFDVAVILSPQDRRSVARIGLLPIRSAGGIYVQLRDIADIQETTGRYVILHSGGRRVQTVTLSVTGRSTDTIVAEAKKRIRAAVSFPKGTYVVFTGVSESEARARQELIINAAIAGAGILLLLSIVLRHYRNVLLLLLNLPFALVGGVLAVMVTGRVLSLGSMVGFVTVFGITLRNSIMMLSHYGHLVQVEGMAWGPETALKGALDRVAPIMMTALVTGLGLLPLAIGSAAAGREIEGRMAIVILGGLITSTALNLLVLPILALKYGRFPYPNRRLEKE